MPRVLKADKSVHIKTIRMEGEIFAYGKASILHRKLTCYTGDKGVVYYADDRFPCTREDTGVIWRAFKRLPKFAHTEKEMTLPLKSIVAAFDKRQVSEQGNDRQAAMAKLYNKELKAAVKEIRKTV